MLVKRTQKGFTLLELIIALLVSLTVMVGILALFFNMIKHSRSTVEAGRLDRTLHAAMFAMATDIRRAGYWANATSSSTNPFMVTGSTDIQVPSSSCILLTYDHNSDGSLPGISSGIDDERYGYRLVNNAIQYRPAGATFSCSAGTDVWTNLTDPNIVKITALTFVKNDQVVDIDGAGAGTATLTVRSITITLTGELVSDSSTSKTITRTVKVYNDKYAP